MYWAGKRERNLCVKFVNLTYHFVVRALHLEEDAEGEDQTADATDDTANNAAVYSASHKVGRVGWHIYPRLYAAPQEPDK